MAWTDYLANKMLDHVFSDAIFTPAANLYWGLSTTAPAADGSNITEPTSNNYSRVLANASHMSAASGRSKTNSSELSFPTPSGDWNTVNNAVLFDAPTAGNALLYAPISARTISSGDSPKIPIGGITHEV